MPSVMRQSLTGNEAEHNTVQEPAADVQGGPQVPASSVTEQAQEGQPSAESTSTPTALVEAAGRRPGMLTGDGGDPSTSTPGMAGPRVLVLRAVCSWCGGVIREGVEPTTHGACPSCADKMAADLLAKVKVYPPLHVIPAEDRVGGYVIRDGRERLLADRIVGINPAAALAHTLNNAVHGHGVCVVHLGERRSDGTCFPCSLKAPRHPFAAVGRS